MNSLFESMALGMSSDPSSALLLASSIGLHQPAESMALLISLLKSSLSKASILLALIAFSLVGPLGSFLGNLITTTKLPFLEGILVSMTAGTFLYAAATEVFGSIFLVYLITLSLSISLPLALYRLRLFLMSSTKLSKVDLGYLNISRC
jgi:zinc transporter ZupT